MGSKQWSCLDAGDLRRARRLEFEANECNNRTRVGQGIKDSDIATPFQISGCVMQSSKIISNFQVFFWTGRNFQPAGTTILWYVKVELGSKSVHGVLLVVPWKNIRKKHRKIQTAPF